MLSGVKPTGRPHIGNYFGAMRQFVDLANSGEYESFVFIADYHGLNFIQNGDEVIEIYPKVFREHFPFPTKNEKALMLRHIFYWFSYCRKWKFPFNQAALNTIDIDEFPELIINLIANQFLEMHQ